MATFICGCRRSILLLLFYSSDLTQAENPQAAVLTMPLSLEDGSKRSRAYPLPQSDLTLRYFPVITGVPPPQGFLFNSTHLAQIHIIAWQKNTIQTISHHLIAVLRRGRRLALPLLAWRLLWNLDIGQRAW